MTTHIEDSCEVVVIGAGPSGLAVARELEHQHGIATLVVDRATAPAMSWRTRYDNFRLNTNGFLSHLPGQRIPVKAGRWPSKEAMVRYYDSYVARQNITIKLGCTVERVDRATDGWCLHTSSGDIRTRAIVLATGSTARPPSHPGRESRTSTARSFIPAASATRGPSADVTSSSSAPATPARISPSSLASHGAGRVWPPSERRRIWCAGHRAVPVGCVARTVRPRACPRDRPADRDLRAPDVG